MPQRVTNITLKMDDDGGHFAAETQTLVVGPLRPLWEQSVVQPLVGWRSCSTLRGSPATSSAPAAIPWSPASTASRAPRGA
jgi:hypothetical protein